jgi:hypothetical protein
MSRIASLAGVVVALFAGVLEAAAPTYPVYLYPVIAKNVGLAGSNWATEVCATNFNGSATLPVYFFFVQDGEILYWHEELPPSKTMCYSDIVDELLGLDHWQGALLISADPDVTYGWKTLRFATRVKVFNATQTGSFGLNVAPEIDHFGIGEPVHFHFSDGSDDDLFIGVASGVQNYGQAGISGERTAIGYLNMGYDFDAGTFTKWQDVVFEVYDRQGNYLYQKSRTVPPLKQAQFTLPEEVVARGGYAKMFLLGDPNDYWGEPGIDFYSYVTITDNQSGDGTYTSFRLPYDGGSTYKRASESPDRDPREMIRKLRDAGARILRPSRRVEP